jgi:hypothetical protein
VKRVRGSLDFPAALPLTLALASVERFDVAILPAKRMGVFA